MEAIPEIVCSGHEHERDPEQRSQVAGYLEAVWSFREADIENGDVRAEHLDDGVDFQTVA